MVEGLEAVDAIQRTPTDSLDRPRQDVRILRARIEGADGEGRQLSAGSGGSAASGFEDL